MTLNAANLVLAGAPLKPGVVYPMFPPDRPATLPGRLNPRGNDDVHKNHPLALDRLSPGAASGSEGPFPLLKTAPENRPSTSQGWFAGAATDASLLRPCNLAKVKAASIINISTEPDPQGLIVT